MEMEAYCSYEIAKLLKEKGFNSPCHAIWYDDRIVLLGHLIDNNSLLLTDEYKFSTQKESLVTIPTHQMACAWLREKGYHIYTFKRESWVYEIQDLNEKDKDYIYFIGGFKEHDIAVEAAVEYVLKKLI